MSLTLDELQGELREYFTRIEEVLSGMDVVVAGLQDRVANLEGLRQKPGEPGGGTSVENRVARLEGQLASLMAALDDDTDAPGPSGIILRP